MGWINNNEEAANLHIFSIDVEGYSDMVVLITTCWEPHNIATALSNKKPLTNSDSNDSKIWKVWSLALKLVKLD